MKKPNGHSREKAKDTEITEKSLRNITKNQKHRLIKVRHILYIYADTGEVILVSNVTRRMAQFKIRQLSVQVLGRL